MRAIATYTLALCLVSVAYCAVPDPLLFSPLIQSKVNTTASNLASPARYPQYTNKQGVWQWFGADTWTTGFFPSTLYALNTRQILCPNVQKNDWVELGRAWSTGMLGLTSGNGQGHDQGFLSFPFVHELEVNPNNQTAINAINAFAKLLAARFNPIVGCTKSWDSNDPNTFQVIIDNMMNLELLFLSAEFTGNKTLEKIAITHADTTIKNHIRPDGGTWHVIVYNTTTGVVTAKRTAQGYSDDSTWSRGQAWGIYGFAQMYTRTKNVTYLETSRRLANYFVNHIPSDGIVPWDFQGPTTPAPRPADSSAAMLAGYALLTLSQVDTTQARREAWLSAAIKIINDNTKFAWNPGFQSLLSNGTVNKPAGNELTGTVYGDYYFILAGNDLVKRGLAKCV